MTAGIVVLEEKKKGAKSKGAKTFSTKKWGEDFFLENFGGAKSFLD